MWRQEPGPVGVLVGASVRPGSAQKPERIRCTWEFRALPGLKMTNKIDSLKRQYEEFFQNNYWFHHEYFPWSICYIFMHVIRIQNRTINWCDILFYCINYVSHSSFCFLLISWKNHKKNIQISIWNYCFEVQIQRNKTEQLKNKKLDVAKWKRTAMYWTMRQVGRGMYGKERNTVIDMNRNIDSQ